MKKLGIVRKPAAAGRFYPRFKSEVISSIQDSFMDTQFGPGEDFSLKPQEGKDRKAIGAVFPHAGYPYSGAAAAISSQNLFGEGIPDTVIILGTTHTGYRKIALMKEGKWDSPLNEIEIDGELAKTITSNSKMVIEDDSAFNGFPHGKEHCIEVQIPFIQYCAEKSGKITKILPIKVGVFDLDKLKTAGREIGEAILKEKEKGKDIAIIASSDMTHYQPRDPFHSKKDIESEQYARDNAVIDSFKTFDIDQVYKNANLTTVCGPQTITLLMVIAKTMGYENPEALKYYTSFDKMGKEEPCDYSVGYFSGLIRN